MGRLTSNLSEEELAEYLHQDEGPPVWPVPLTVKGWPLAPIVFYSSSEWTVCGCLEPLQWAGLADECAPCVLGFPSPPLLFFLSSCQAGSPWLVSPDKLGFLFLPRSGLQALYDLVRDHTIL